jgi:hypothetical protein
MRAPFEGPGRVAARLAAGAAEADAQPVLVLEHFQEKWNPVFRRKCDQRKSPRARSVSRKLNVL